MPSGSEKSASADCSLVVTFLSLNSGSHLCVFAHCLPRQVNSWTQSALDEEQALRSNLAWEKSWAEWVVWVGKHARTDNAS